MKTNRKPKWSLRTAADDQLLDADYIEGREHSNKERFLRDLKSILSDGSITKEGACQIGILCALYGAGPFPALETMERAAAVPIRLTYEDPNGPLYSPERP